MRKIIRDNGLLLVNAGLFLVFLVAMSLAGVREFNADQLSHHEAVVSFWHYVTSGAFAEAVFENWESEFLQMGMYVVLTAYLFQRGSSESKPIEGEAPQDEDPAQADKRKPVPWPVRRGGLVLRLYENSLAAFFFLLFFLSIGAHAVGGAKDYSEEQVTHGQSAVTTWQYA